ncbi:MAG: ribosomal protein S18-alanine N-acetyltransferase [Proteobacteria bacterium]|nr:ribosomal protein S18-alanine N-acetyltransferase [Pseudomonadota bacterium]
MIRRFELADIEEILHIEARAFPKSSYTADMFLDFYRRYSDTFFVLKEEQVRGYIIFKPDGHVISLAVDPPYRRRGIGTRLMRACESCCRVERLFVEVREGNIVAQKFYEKLGFVLKARISRYYGTEDALVMEKNWPPTRD